MTGKEIFEFMEAIKEFTPGVEFFPDEGKHGEWQFSVLLDGEYVSASHPTDAGKACEEVRRMILNHHKKKAQEPIPFPKK